MKRRLTLTVMAILAFVFLQVQPGLAQTTEEFKALKDEVKALKDGQTIILKDLQDIKKLLASRPTAQPAEFKEAIIKIQGAPVKGDDKAKLVLMEFSDYV